MSSRDTVDGARLRRPAISRQDSPATTPREISSRSASDSRSGDRRGTIGWRPPVNATSIRNATIERPNARLIARRELPALYLRQISAFSCTVNADRTIITTSIVYKHSQPVRRGGAFTD
jgi:hypothetical protein